jgi:hypothetical protein
MNCSLTISLAAWPLLVVLSLLVGAVIILFYGVIPLLAKRSQFLYGERELIPTTTEDLNETAREGIRRAVRDLGAEGFEVVANYRHRGGNARLLMVSVLFVNRAAGHFAQGFFVSIGSESTYRETWNLVIRTRFADGFEMNTASSTSDTAFPTDPMSDSINPYWIRDGRLLWAIHRARIEGDARKGQRRIVPDPGKEAEFLNEDFRREIDHVVATGYYVPDEIAGRYRLTIKGAYLIIWRLLWPLKHLRRAARKRRAQSVLRELGFCGEAIASAARLPGPRS